MGKDGDDRKEGQRSRCRACRCRFPATAGTPSSSDRFPPGISALAIRWYRRSRSSYADVAELLAERGGCVAPATLFAWAREFAPLDEESAPPFRHASSERWRVAATYAKAAGQWCRVYRAIDEAGRVVAVYVSEHRAADDAATCFRQAIASMSAVPTGVTTDRAATYPAAPTTILPGVEHGVGKRVRQRIEREHQHRKGRLGGVRGFGTLRGAWAIGRAHGVLRNLRGGCYDFRPAPGRPDRAAAPLVARGWDALTSAPWAR
jgi:IS6 family transposase